LAVSIRVLSRHGFADAGGRLDEDLPRAPQRAVNGHRHGPLIPPVSSERKNQPPDGFVPFVQPATVLVQPLPIGV
jgi:hypothetical protein